MMNSQQQAAALQLQQQQDSNTEQQQKYKTRIYKYILVRRTAAYSVIIIGQVQVPC